MWWNGVYVQEHRPGAVEFVAGGLGRYLGLLFFLSPYLFIPYLLYRSVNQAPAPALYLAVYVVPGAFLVYYLVKYCFTHLYQWKKEGGGFKASAALFLSLTAFLVIRVWAVQAGVARIFHSSSQGMVLSEGAAVLYVLLLLHAQVNRKFFRRR